MQEQLLHFIWQRKLFDHADLRTTCGQQVEIIHPGFPNHDQGPDFLQARIKLDDRLWAGHVEIHVRSSAWFVHMHERDPHYNNVVLHVVWDEDQPALTSGGVRIPSLELQAFVSKDLLVKYDHLMNVHAWVPCVSSLQNVPHIVRTSWLERLMSERLEHKTSYISHIWERCQCDFEQTFFVLLSRHLGSPSNSDAMENLALMVPLHILRKHGDRTDQIEAILFGVAGMLEKEIPSGYPLKLKREFDFLKAKYGLSVIPALQWKFMRMRPVHFPTVRIAQLASLIAKVHHYVTLVSELTDAEDWIRLFMVCPDNIYWDTHYHFRSESPHLEKHLGKDTAISLIINTVIPFMFFYGKMQGRKELIERAIAMSGTLPAEKNSIVKTWAAHGWKAGDAGQSQAMLHLKKRYCDERNCLHCAIGLQLLK